MAMSANGCSGDANLGRTALKDNAADGMSDEHSISSSTTMEEQTAVSVTEITRQIKQSLETRYPRVWVQGELSNVKFHTSGHLYFTLKDEGAQISGVMWRSRVQTLRSQLQDGMKVTVRGAITVYPPRGAYQIDAEHIQPSGLGELQARFEALKRKLAAEGLFDTARKRVLPEFPESIGIITSETGAALHDMITVFARRMPSVELVVLPVRVQGTGAAKEIAAALADMNAFGGVNLIIVGRGGGSLEDLWAFNEEEVARAIAASRLPVVSAVGHEVDVTIADFVADLRAPTPTAAAELVVRDRRELLEVLANMWYTTRRRTEEVLRAERDHLHQLSGSYALNRPRDLLREYLQRMDEHTRALEVSAGHFLRHRQESTATLAGKLSALHPKNVLKRGFAIVRARDGVRTRADEVVEGESARIEFHDGSVAAHLEKRL